MRILIVQGNTLVAAGLAVTLEDVGYQMVGIACDAPGALALAAACQPDVALVGVRLSDGATGNGVAVALRGWHGVVPVMVTASPELVTPEARAASLAVLDKVTNPRDLLAILAKCVPPSPVRSPRRSPHAWPWPRA
jgi:DNA-binding NarL/FixJ family response regulator